MERNFIGQIKVKVNGELCDARVTDDGYLVFPNGREQKLSSDRFMAVIKKLKAEVEAAPQPQPVQPEPVVPQQPPVMTPPVQENPYVQPQQRQYVEPAPVQQPVPEPVYNPQPMYVAGPAPVQSTQPVRQQAPNEVIQAAESKKNKKGKKEKPVKEAPVKEKKQKGNAAAVILALGLVAVILAFIAGIYSGIITINPIGSAVPNTGTVMNQEFDQEIPMDTDKVLIVARSVGADGTVKESILGYFDNASTGGSVFNGPNEPVNQNGGAASVGEINAGDVADNPVAPEGNNGGQVVIQ